MIGYLDTSALVPMLVAEPTSAACRRFWDAADDVVTCRLTYVESAAALAQARRHDRLDVEAHDRAVELLDDLWRELDLVEVDDPLTRSAARLAVEQGLRGYDAVHCAAASSLAHPDLVAAAGDRALLRAWTAIGVATYDTAG